MVKEKRKEEEELQRSGALRSVHPFPDLCKFLEEDELVGISSEGNGGRLKMADFSLNLFYVGISGELGVAVTGS